MHETNNCTEAPLRAKGRAPLPCRFAAPGTFTRSLSPPFLFVRIPRILQLLLQFHKVFFQGDSTHTVTAAADFVIAVLIDLLIAVTPAHRDSGISGGSGGS